jgi:hypothetical protein
MAAYRELLRKYWKNEKMKLKLILNKTSPWANMEWEFEVLGVPGKLVKYVVDSSKRKN